MGTLTEILMGLLVVVMLLPAVIVEVYAQAIPPGIENLLPDDTTGTTEAPPLSSAEDIENLYNSRIGATQTSLQIMNTTRQQCEADGFFTTSCISLIYDSPTTVVFDGALLLLETGTILEGGRYWPNPYIWRAVDQFKQQGYSLLSVELEGQGSRGNPHTIIVVMSK